MTLDQQKQLEMFANLFARMDNTIQAMADGELQLVLKACQQASTTNCWCYTWDAAQYLLPKIRTEEYQRKQRAEAAAVPNGDRGSATQ